MFNTGMMVLDLGDVQADMDQQTRGITFTKAHAYNCCDIMHACVVDSGTKPVLSVATWWKGLTFLLCMCIASQSVEQILCQHPFQRSADTYGTTMVSVFSYSIAKVNAQTSLLCWHAGVDVYALCDLEDS